MDVQVRGVDHQVGGGAQSGQQAALAAGRVQQPALTLKRQRPAHRLLASDDRVVVRVQEQDQRDHAALAEGVEGGRDLLEGRTGADVQPDGDPGEVTLAGDLGQFRQHLRGKVVDHIPPQVLEGVAGGAATRAGHAGDDDEAQR